MKNWKALIFAALIVVVAGFWFVSEENTRSSALPVTGRLSAQTVELGGTEFIVYKSPNCGCCGGYVQYLKDTGMSVKVVEKADMDPIKKQYNIPGDMLSCHTSTVGKYFVEGHVPIEAVEKLLAEEPDVDGIALPGMPAGSAGMSGAKNAPFVVYAIKDGESFEFARV